MNGVLLLNCMLFHLHVINLQEVFGALIGCSFLHMDQFIIGQIEQIAYVNKNKKRYTL